MLGGEVGHHVVSQRCLIAYRLVEVPGYFLHLVNEVLGAYENLVVVGLVALRDEPRVCGLVEGPFLEPDRERPQRFGVLLGRECGEQRRVDAARQQDTHRHVADEMRADRVAHA